MLRWLCWLVILHCHLSHSLLILICMHLAPMLFHRGLVASEGCLNTDGFAGRCDPLWLEARPLFPFRNYHIGMDMHSQRGLVVMWVGGYSHGPTCSFCLRVAEDVHSV